MGFAVFLHPPASAAVRTFLDRVIHAAGTPQKHLINDKGSQFGPCAAFNRWCKRQNTKPQFGAIWKHRSIERSATQKPGVIWELWAKCHPQCGGRLTDFSGVGNTCVHLNGFRQLTAF
jgi:hypothetical protein